MPAIDESNRYATLINSFSVEPEKQQELVDLLNEVTEKVMRHQPGFVSASIHASTDGKRVVNYVQWESAKAFEAMMSNEEAREHMGKASKLAEADPHIYRVVKAHTK